MRAAFVCKTRLRDSCQRKYPECKKKSMCVSAQSGLSLKCLKWSVTFYRMIIWIADFNWFIVPIWKDTIKNLQRNKRSLRHFFETFQACLGFIIALQGELFSTQMQFRRSSMSLKPPAGLQETMFQSEFDPRQSCLIIHVFLLTLISLLVNYELWFKVYLTFYHSFYQLWNASLSEVI